jgi:hypothetical protein
MAILALGVVTLFRRSALDVAGLEGLLLLTFLFGAILHMIFEAQGRYQYAFEMAFFYLAARALCRGWRQVQCAESSKSS